MFEFNAYVNKKISTFVLDSSIVMNLKVLKKLVSKEYMLYIPNVVLYEMERLGNVSQEMRDSFIYVKSLLDKKVLNMLRVKTKPSQINSIYLDDSWTDDYILSGAYETPESLLITADKIMAEKANDLSMPCCLIQGNDMSNFFVRLKANENLHYIQGYTQPCIWAKVQQLIKICAVYTPVTETFLGHYIVHHSTLISGITEEIFVVDKYFKLKYPSSRKLIFPDNEVEEGEYIAVKLQLKDLEKVKYIVFQIEKDLTLNKFYETWLFAPLFEDRVKLAFLIKQVKQNQKE